MAENREALPRRTSRGPLDWPPTVEVTKNPDGTVSTKVWPGAGVRAVAELLRSWYVSEHETDAPVTDWVPQAKELVDAYLTAEGAA